MQKLLGLDLDKARAALEKQGVAYEVTDYASARPYEDADARRVVRALRSDGMVRLVVCGFKTRI